MALGSLSSASFLACLLLLQPGMSTAQAPEANGVYQQGPGVVMPKVLTTVDPEFSEKARKRRVSGRVKVEFVVDVDGHTRNLHIVRSAAESYTSPKDHKDRDAALTLDQKAIEAVSHYTFTPGHFQGQPVPVKIQVEVNFQVF